MTIRFQANPLAHSLKLALMLGVIGGSVAYADDKELPTAHLGTLQVTVSADASGAGLKRAYAGGQVATGGRVGILGNQNTQDTPFSTVAYTNQFITDKQADSVGDVLQKDPTVRVARGYGNYQETYFMRGFLTYSDQTMFNGLYGVLPRQSITSELFERVEVQRGASAALNGAAPGGGNIGGTISLLPKRRTTSPTRSVNVTSENGQNIKVAADVGQRFGKNNEFGVRTNVALQTGGSAIDNEDKKLGLLAVGLDYRKAGTRLSADLGYQNNNLDSIRPALQVTDWQGVVSGGGIPALPKNTSNFSQSWMFSDEKSLFGTLRGEYDINKHLTAYGAYGFRKGDESSVLASPTLNNLQGDIVATYLATEREDKVQTGEVGLKGKAEFGTQLHNWVASYNTYTSTERSPWGQGTAVTDNIYNHKDGTKSDVAFKHWAWGVANPVSTRTQFDSFALADTMSLLDDKLQLTLAARYQKLSSENYRWDDNSKTEYKKSKFTPTLGASYALSPEVSVYGNYAESLKEGTTVYQQDSTGKVTGVVFNAPYVSKQSEVGVKYDNSKLGGTLSAFHTKAPRSRGGAENGKDIHQGLELSVYGSPISNVRVLGGMSFIRAEQKDTKETNIDGKRVIGVPKFQANAGVEYDLPSIEGLTLTGDVIHTGSRYANDLNTLKVKGYTTLDLGARYETELAGRGVTLRGTIQNATNKAYWGSVGGYPGYGYLTIGEPRTVKVSATIDF